MDYIEIKGYKSIKEAKVELKPINILIGANGAGKTNFISFFEFLNKLYDQKLEEYVALSGGAAKMLHNGSKETSSIKALITFNNAVNAYSFEIKETGDAFVFGEEQMWYHKNSWNIAQFGKESKIKNASHSRAKYIREYLNGLKKYHFHDTGKKSPFTETSNINKDIFFLYDKGSNLSAFLYGIQMQHPIVYNRIIKTIQSIAPYFSDFYFQPNAEGFLRLLWQDKYSSSIYDASDLSDGTIRFIALATLFMQPNLPDTLVIDEPELGLHPFAIAKLAGLIQSIADRGTQVIIATQSIDLVNYFTPEDIITVDHENGESVFTRLKAIDLSNWLKDYSLGDLWKRSIIEGGQP